MRIQLRPSTRLRPFAVSVLLLITCLIAPGEGEAEDCLTSGCHVTLESLKNLHPPIEEGECSSCHRRRAAEPHPLKGGTSFELVHSDKELCLQCHEVPGEGKITHAPTEEGNCLTCHSPHGSAGRFLLRGTEGTAGVCRGCHDDPAAGQPIVHGPVAAGDCTVCHDPHRSVEKTLLRKPVRKLCIACHTDFEALEKAPVSHPPVRTDPCTKCHLPHSSPAANLLAAGLPDLCLTCHQKVGRKMQTAKSRHAPLYRQESCGICHSTHYSDHRGLLPTRQDTLCLSCHGKDDHSKSKALRNIGKELQKKKFLHGPLQDGECAACHDPHGTDSFRLLSGNYPSDFYVPYQSGTYEFCLQCHDQNLLAEKVKANSTRFRNGDINLHFLHAADPQKARTCRACHEPHAADNQQLIRTEGAPFGDWKIPIRFQPTANGGSCSPGCHRTLAYDRETPARN